MKREDEKYQAYVQILKEELVPAMGCTEPIALAYAAAKAREVFGGMPEHVTAWCSGNIIKNVRCVTIPNSGNMMGIEAGVTLGMVGGDAGRQMEVLESVTPEDIHAVVYDVLRHRIILTFEAQAEGVTTDDIIATLLRTVPLP